MKNPIIDITPKAKEQLNNLARSTESTGKILLKVDKSGCVGFGYKLDFCNETPKGAEEIKLEKISLFIDPLSVLFLMNTSMDWKEDMFDQRFIFNNPNVINECGCGESVSF